MGRSQLGTLKDHHGDGEEGMGVGSSRKGNGMGMRRRGAILRTSKTDLLYPGGAILTLVQ